MDAQEPSARCAAKRKKNAPRDPLRPWLEGLDEQSKRIKSTAPQRLQQHAPLFPPTPGRHPEVRLFHRTSRQFPPNYRFPPGFGAFPRGNYPVPPETGAFPRRPLPGSPRHRTLSPAQLASSPDVLGVPPGLLDAPNATEAADFVQFMRFNAKSAVGRVTPCAPLFSWWGEAPDELARLGLDRPACHFFR